MLYDNYFHEVVPEEDRLRAVNSTVFPMAMDFARQVSPALQIVRAPVANTFPHNPHSLDGDKTRLVLGLAGTGWPVLECAIQWHDGYQRQFVLRNWCQQLRKRGHVRTELAGKMPGYVKKSFKKVRGDEGVAKLCRKTHDEIIKQMEAASQHYSYQLASEYKDTPSYFGITRDYNCKEDLTRQQVEWLVKLANNQITRTDIPVDEMTQIEKVYAKKREKEAQQAAYNARLAEHMTVPKWVMAYMEDPNDAQQQQTGYYLLGTAQYKGDGAVDNHNLKLYRSVDEYLALNPDEGRQLLASHMFMRTHLEKENNRPNFQDKAGWIPSGDHAYTKVGAFTYYQSRGITHPQWLFMDKLP